MRDQCCSSCSFVQTRAYKARRAGQGEALSFMLQNNLTTDFYIIENIEHIGNVQYTCNNLDIKYNQYLYLMMKQGSYHQVSSLYNNRKCGTLRVPFL